MDKNTAKRRFAFLAEAFEGSGGFATEVAWESQVITTQDQAGTPLTAVRRVPKLSGVSHLVPYQRESAEKYAGRVALAVYENHLREACERYVGYLGRKRPARSGTEGPLVQLMLSDADMRGTPLDQFLATLALNTKARGSMLVLIDMPAVTVLEGGQEGAGGENGEPPTLSLAQQIEGRLVPVLRAIEPENVDDYEVDPDTGLFVWVDVACVEQIDGKATRCTRRWTAEGWQVIVDGEVVKSGDHPFGHCPVLALTESGDTFPVVGKFAQVADLSRDIFNLRSELRELLRSQTFSILTMQVPAEASALFDPAKTAASIGTHSMLVHQGITPAFVAPESGPAETYMKDIAQKEASIKRITMDNTDAGDKATQESGEARRLRFERLNSDLATFASRMQTLEAQLWALFHKAIGTPNRVVSTWPTDFNLTDVAAELDILTLMQGASFPDEVIAAKQEAIVEAEFDTLPDAEKTALKQAVRNQTQEVRRKPQGEPDDDTTTSQDE